MTDALVNLWGRRIGGVSWEGGRAVGIFEYDPAFRAAGMELSPFVMPLREAPYVFPALSSSTFIGLPDLLADALPGRFGNRLIDAWLATTGRRFDLARLLAERLLNRHQSEPLRAVTKSYTYRQKAQRALAAEFLAPIDAVDAFLAGDCSEERQTEAAEHFAISPYAIQSLLVNNHRLGHQGAPEALDRL